MLLLQQTLLISVQKVIEEELIWFQYHSSSRYRLGLQGLFSHTWKFHWCYSKKVMVIFEDDWLQQKRYSEDGFKGKQKARDSSSIKHSCTSSVYQKITSHSWPSMKYCNEKINGNLVVEFDDCIWNTEELFLVKRVHWYINVQFLFKLLLSFISNQCNSRIKS
jgi:hypothetical protein